MGYQKQNERTIDRAFRRMVDNKDMVIEKKMIELLQNAVYFALRSHDETHDMHINMGDSYGWVLLHDGKAVRHEITAGGDAEVEARSNAYTELMSVSREVPQVGWVGIILAGMHKDVPPYFEVDYEIGILQETFDHTTNKAMQYVKSLESKARSNKS